MYSCIVHAAVTFELLYPIHRILTLACRPDASVNSVWSDATGLAPVVDTAHFPLPPQPALGLVSLGGMVDLARRLPPAAWRALLGTIAQRAHPRLSAAPWASTVKEPLELVSVGERAVCLSFVAVILCLVRRSLDRRE